MKISPEASAGLDGSMAYSIGAALSHSGPQRAEELVAASH